MNFWKTGRRCNRSEGFYIHSRIPGVKSLPKNLATHVALFGDSRQRPTCNVDLVLSEEDYSKQMLRLEFAFPLGPEESAKASIEVRPLRELKSWFPRNKITESYDITYRAEDAQTAYQPLGHLPLSEAGLDAGIALSHPWVYYVPLSPEFFEGEDLSIYLKIKCERYVN